MVARKIYRAARAVRFLVKNFDVVSQTTSLNLEISRCHLADYVKELYQSACRTCSTIIFTHSTNQIIVFWRRRCSCRRPCLKLPKLPEVVFRGRSVETLGRKFLACMDADIYLVSFFRSVTKSQRYYPSVQVERDRNPR